LRGLKTTYYLRTIGATQAEKSTVKAGQMNSVSSSAAPVRGAATSGADQVAASARAQLAAAELPATDIKFCAIDDPGCEACQ
jgi:ribonucleoside-diphosphate reductase alpha chain